MNKVLDIPVHKQPEESFTCSLACLEMIMDYYGDHVLHKRLVDDLKEWINEDEVHLEGVGLYLVKRGYNVHFIHHSPGVITTQLDNITEKDKVALREALDQAPDHDKAQFYRRKLSLGIDYIESGGQYSTTIPTLKLLDNNIENDILTMICVSNDTWVSDPKVSSNHYVVVRGKKSNKYVVNDPGSGREDTYYIDADRLLMAWYRTGAYTLYTSGKKKNPAS
jgi:ABC-type bacteriocin/lantibiotic exporter with double-glycine peptidase domain